MSKYQNFTKKIKENEGMLSGNKIFGGKIKEEKTFMGEIFFLLKLQTNKRNIFLLILLKIVLIKHNTTKAPFDII